MWMLGDTMNNTIAIRKTAPRYISLNRKGTTQQYYASQRKRQNVFWDTNKKPRGKTKKKIYPVLLILIISNISILRTNPANLKTQPETITYTKCKAYLFVSPDSSYAGIEKILKSANNTLKIMVYEFWSPEIKGEIINALNRRVKVYLLMEGDTYGEIGDYWNRDMLSELYQLNKTQNKPIWIRLENTTRYMHAKVIIADTTMVFISSENFMPTSYPPTPTTIELTPYERPSRGWGTIIKNTEIAKKYEEYFDAIFYNDQYSREYNPDTNVGQAPEQGGIIKYSPIMGMQEVEAYAYPVFTPENSLETIKWLISRANYTIYLSLMYITQDQTTQQLIDQLKQAKERGVTIHIILEDSLEYYQEMAQTLESYGFHVVPAFSQQETLFLHNKGIIIDDKIILIGSINWSEKALTQNWEAAILIKSTQAAQYYKEIYEYDWNKSTKKPFDSDGDGLSDYYEEEHNYNPKNPDTDNDGTNDWEEVYIQGNKYGNYNPKAKTITIIIIVAIVAIIIIIAVIYIIKKKQHKQN